MKKWIILSLSLSLGLVATTGHAQDDKIVAELFKACTGLSGVQGRSSPATEGDKTCITFTCKVKSSNLSGDVTHDTANNTVPSGQATSSQKKCIATSEYNRVIDGILDGSLVVSPAGTPAGANAGGTPAGANAGGTPAGANAGGTPAGANAGAEDNGPYQCIELEEDLEMKEGMPCFRQCRPRRYLLILGKREGYDRPNCVKCLLGYPGLYKVKAAYVPAKYKNKDGTLKAGKDSVKIAGATVKTGQVVCYDKKGNVVATIGAGAVVGANGHVCPAGSHNGNGIIVGGTTSSAGNGGIIVGGTAASAGNGIIVGGNTASAGGGVNIIVGGSTANANGGGSAGVTIPSECVKNNGKIKTSKKCQAYLSGAYTISAGGGSGGSRFNCANGSSTEGCVGSDEYNAIMSRYYSGADCVNCQASSRKQSTLSGIAEIVGAIAPPLAAFGSSYFQSKAYQKGQEAWAGAAATGFEQCRLSQADYLAYLQSNELPGMTPDQQSAQNCNGYGLGGFAGMGGGLNGYYGSGYSNGMIGGMMGPYGGYNPYPGGMYTSGMAGGMYTSGMAGGYPGGMYAGGISIAGGVTSGLAGGMYPGGMAGGMYTSGMAGGYPGGMAGGMYTSGMAGGLAGGLYVAGGMASGYPGGMAGGMYTSGMAGGYPGGMYAGGMAGGMYAGGMAGGMYTSGSMAGGWASGVGQGNYYNGMLSNQAAGIDAQLQQQGLAYNMGQMSSGSMYGFGNQQYYGASGYPSNMGGGLGLNLQFGGGFYR